MIEPLHPNDPNTPDDYVYELPSETEDQKADHDRDWDR